LKHLQSSEKCISHLGVSNVVEMCQKPVSIENFSNQNKHLSNNNTRINNYPRLRAEMARLIAETKVRQSTITFSDHIDGLCRTNPSKSVDAEFFVVLDERTSV